MIKLPIRICISILVVFALVTLVWLENQTPSAQFQLHPSFLETILTSKDKEKTK